MYDQYPPPPPPGYFQNNPFPPEKPKQTAIHLWRVVGLNFGIFMCYQVLFALAGDSMTFMILDMFPLVAHWIVMLVFMIVQFSRGKTMSGIGWLISLVVFAIIGFGSCFWIADMLGGSGHF
jgi:hypothetical protein